MHVCVFNSFSPRSLWIAQYSTTKPLLNNNCICAHSGMSMRMQRQCFLKERETTEIHWPRKGRCFKNSLLSCVIFLCVFDLHLFTMG